MLSPSIGVCWTSVVVEGTMISTRKICRHRQLQLQVPGEAREGALPHTCDKRYIQVQYELGGKQSTWAP